MTRNLQLEPGKAAELASPSVGLPSATPQIVYLVRREGLSSVFASQVATKMAAVAEAGFEVDVAVFAPFGQWLRSGQRRRWQGLVDSLPPAIRGRVWRLPSFPSRIDWPMAEARVLAWWLRRRYGRCQARVVLQCRNATATRMALAARRALPGARVIFDCRGVQDHEFLYVRGATFDTAPAKLKAEALRLAEEQRLAAAESDAVLCVSEALADYLVRECGISRKKCVVVPCCVDTRRAATAAERRDDVRRRLGFEGRFVVAYCGSLGKWQLARQSLQLFEQIRSLEPLAHFFAVTTQPDAMRAAASEVGVPPERMTIVSLPHAEVAAHLAAADVGLLLRERSVVNEVASPVKFAEYLACGVPVILSEGIGDYSELARRTGVGVVLAHHTSAVDVSKALADFLRRYQQESEELRRQCRAVAERELATNVHVPRIAAIYDKLAK
jgi:glycosyltransferase involved in cell wall biosynthesis